MGQPSCGRRLNAWPGIVAVGGLSYAPAFDFPTKGLDCDLVAVIEAFVEVRIL